MHDDDGIYNRMISSPANSSPDAKATRQALNVTVSDWFNLDESSKIELIMQWRKEQGGRK